jgi:hypothetical protein
MLTGRAAPDDPAPRMSLFDAAHTGDSSGRAVATLAAHGADGTASALRRPPAGGAIHLPGAGGGSAGEPLSGATMRQVGCAT